MKRTWLAYLHVGKLPPTWNCVSEVMFSDFYCGKPPFAGNMSYLSFLTSKRELCSGIVFTPKKGESSAWSKEGSPLYNTQNLGGHFLEIMGKILEFDKLMGLVNSLVASSEHQMSMRCCKTNDEIS